MLLLGLGLTTAGSADNCPKAGVSATLFEARRNVLNVTPNVLVIGLLTAVADLKAETIPRPALPITVEGWFLCLLVEIVGGFRAVLMSASAGFKSPSRNLLLGAADNLEASAPSLTACAVAEGVTDGSPPPNRSAPLVFLAPSAPTAASFGALTTCWFAPAGKL